LGGRWKTVANRPRYNTRSTKNAGVGIWGRCRTALE
jgi:hypothetical protein